jgi:putative hydrolase of the HAD superfamily
MIRAVFFDWYSTLANIDGPRSHQYIKVFRDLGIEISPEKAARGVLRADEYLTSEEERLPLAARSREERTDIYIIYPRMILDEAGMRGREDVAVAVRDRMRELRKEPRPVSIPSLFADVLPAVKALKDRGILLGVISNASRELSRHCQEVGLMPYLDVVLTSQEAGARKPEPLIFLTALNKINIPAAEAIFVGDQYKADVQGARGAGMSPVLLDRFDLYPHIADCLRIRSLSELTLYLQ